MSELNGISSCELNSLKDDVIKQGIGSSEKTETVVTKKFAMMRVAAHDKQDHLTIEGQKRAYSAMVVLADLAKEAGADKIRVIHSDTPSARQTVEFMRRYQLDDRNIQDARLNESQSGPLLKQLKKENPTAYQEYGQLSPEAKFEAKPVVGYESGREMFNRMNAAVQTHLASADDKTFTVFITHQNCMLNWMRGLGEQVPADWKKHHATSGEIYPLQQINGIFSQLRDRQRPVIIEGIVP